MDDGVDGLIDIDAVTRMVYTLSHLERIEALVETADKIYANLPRSVKEQMVCGECATEDGLGPHSTIKIAMALAQLPPTVRDDLTTILEEVKQYVGVWVNPEDAPEGSFYGMLNDTDMSVITEMITLVQKMGPRSTRALLHALEASNAGDWNYILIQAKGRQTEVSTRRSVSDATKQEFQME